MMEQTDDHLGMSLGIRSGHYQIEWQERRVPSAMVIYSLAPPTTAQQPNLSVTSTSISSSRSSRRASVTRARPMKCSSASRDWPDDSQTLAFAAWELAN